MGDKQEARPGDRAGLTTAAAPRKVSWLRRFLHSFVPAGLHDPIGLARRLLKTRDPAARFALRAAALGPVLMPFDLLLTPFEHRRYRRAPSPRLPIVIVCGCARSGTTVTAQLLLERLPVSFLTNLTSVFPRSPLTAESLIGPMLSKREASLHNFYGRTSGWTAPNDGLQVWDRWLGKDRSLVPETLTPASRAAMSSFFGAREQQTGRPALVKVNALNACAHLVADALPTARFVCVDRSRVGLVKSLLKARSEIHGRADVPYGLMPPAGARSGDPVEDVCRQVLFHEEIAQRQRERLGPDRFMIVSLEDIIRDSDGFVDRIGREILGRSPTAPAIRLRPEVGSIAVNAEQRSLEHRIEETFERLTRT